MFAERPPRLLVVDDSVDEIAVLTTLLTREGFHVNNETDGLRGLAAAQRDRPDAMLLDLHMPGLDGFQVLTALRGDGRTAEIPVVVVSGSANDGDVVRALEMGATDYVSKPYAIEILLARVRAAIRSRREKEAIWRLGEDLRLAQEELSRARRSAAIGAIAAGLAHEINNPAAFVVTDLHEIRELAHDLANAGDEDHGEAITSLAEEALAGMNRIRDVVRDLSVFASVVNRRSVPSTGALDLAAITTSRAERFGTPVTVLDGDRSALVAPGLGGEDELDALVGLLIRHASAQSSDEGPIVLRIERGDRYVCLHVEAVAANVEASSESALTLTIARELAERFGGSLESGRAEGTWILRLARAGVTV